MEKPERQPYVHWTTCYDYRGDVDYRRVFLQKKKRKKKNKKKKKKKRKKEKIDMRKKKGKRGQKGVNPPPPETAQKFDFGHKNCQEKS